MCMKHVWLEHCGIIAFKTVSKVIKDNFTAEEIKANIYLSYATRFDKVKEKTRIKRGK